MADFVSGLTVDEFQEKFGTVKSAQRGTVTLNYSTQSVTVNINPINMTKSIVLVSNCGNEAWVDYGRNSPSVRVEITSDTTIVVTSSTSTSSSNAYNYVAWQVIEYY